MKKFFQVTALLLCLINNTYGALPTFDGIGNDGGGPKQSWSEIYKNPNLSPVFPSYNIQGRMIAYKNLCLVGERVRTKYKHVVKQDIEFKILFDYLTTDRVRTESVCRQEIFSDCSGCTEWDEKTYEIPLELEVEVRQKNEHFLQQESKPSFKKKFKLQDCIEF